MRKTRRRRRKKTLVLQSLKKLRLCPLFPHLALSGRYPCLSACLSPFVFQSSSTPSKPFFSHLPVALCVSSSCCQPSVYLRLLENPGAVAQHTASLSSPTSPLPQSGYSRSSSPSGSHSPPRSPSPSAALRYYSERTSPGPNTTHLSAADIDHSSDGPTQQVTVLPAVFSLNTCAENVDPAEC